MVEIETRKFYQGGVEYEFKWVEKRHHLPNLAQNFGNKLIKYYNFVCSNVYPEKLFNNTEILRCSSFKLKNLDKDGLKKISLELIKNNYVTLVNDENSAKDVSKSIVFHKGLGLLFNNVSAKDGVLTSFISRLILLANGPNKFIKRPIAK